MLSSAQLDALLQTALQATRDGQLGRAEQLARQALSVNSAHPAPLQLLGVVRSMQGDLVEAETLMRRSLDLMPNQPHVWNNLGNVYAKIPNPDEAIRCYRQAVALETRYFDAWKNLGLMLAAGGKHEEALEAYDRAQALSPENPDTLNGKGLSLKALKRFEDAETALTKAAECAPASVSILNNLGNVLRDLGKDQAGAKIFEKAAKLMPDAGHLRIALSGAYINLGRFDEAEANLRDVIDQEPDNVEAHKTLTKTLFNVGRNEDIATLYENTLAEYPDLVLIWEEYAESLWLLDKFEEGLAVVEKARAKCGDRPKLRLMTGRMLSSIGKPEEARKWLDLSGKNDEQMELFFAIERARVNLLSGEYRSGADDLYQVSKKFPDDYTVFAHLESLWRMAGDPRAAWLLDYEHFVRPMEVPVPDGFKNHAEFNAALTGFLTSLHVSRHHPIDQTLRGGTQTYGHLFERTEPIIRSLKNSIQESIEDYSSALKYDSGHPFLRHLGKPLWFKGAWSVRLRSEGFHVHHYHPEGWISSAYYVSLPDSVADPDKKDGRIQFGMPPVDVPDACSPAKEIQPRVGTLALFPSYCWHGTIPFSDSEPRLTVAFDVGRS